jgi:hypothetical protein
MLDFAWEEILSPQIFTTKYFPRRMSVISMLLHLETTLLFQERLVLRKKSNFPHTSVIGKNTKMKAGIYVRITTAGDQ